MPQLFIVVAALSWGFISIFVKKLTAYGFSEMEIVTIRVLYAFLFIIPLILIKRKKVNIKIKMIHLPYFFGTGLCSIVFFNWCYFYAMNKLSISLAVMLLYTSPAFVAVLSMFILKEKLSMKKIIAIIITVLGCSIIALAGSSGGVQWNQTGFLIGLGAGLGYALYSIFGKLALKHYDSMTITFYTFLIAAICLAPFYRFWEKMNQLPLEIHAHMIGLAIFPTVLAYLLYTIGLKRIESSTAAILATIEPVAAIFVGLLFFQESLEWIQIIGIICILSSVLILSMKRRTVSYSSKLSRRI